MQLETDLCQINDMAKDLNEYLGSGFQRKENFEEFSTVTLLSLAQYFSQTQDFPLLFACIANFRTLK